MDPGFKTPNFSAISIALAKDRRSPFSALLRQTSAAATILGTLRTPCASLIRTFLKKASLSSPALFFLPLGRPFGFPDWPFLKRVCMSFRSSSAILLFHAAVRDDSSRGARTSLFRDVLKSSTGPVEARWLSAVALPAPHGDVDIQRVDFHCMPSAPGLLRCNQCAAAAAKRGQVQYLSVWRHP